jgi:hypothetical protein
VANLGENPRITAAGERPVTASGRSVPGVGFMAMTAPTTRGTGPDVIRHVVLAPERVTRLLRRAGRLGDRGHVVAVVHDGDRNTIVSRLERLRVQYAGQPPTAPEFLLLKTPLRDLAPAVADGARSEARFYSEVAPFSPREVLAECFDASAGSGDTSCYVLLEDLSATHAAPIGWPVPPDVPACEGLVDAYARFHAAWWDDARLGTSVGAFLDEPAAAALCVEVETRWPVFREMLGDRLSGERAARYERLVGGARAVLDRARARRRDLTVMHGDAHMWNALYPIGADGTVRIIDWAGWRVGVGARDLAYMIALHWYPDRRRRLERPLLRRYHDALLAHGVTGYPWEALLDDYRWSALWQILTPMWQATLKLPPVIWWGHLERAMLAFEDLDCAPLLDRP